MIACNTASTLVLSHLRAAYAVPFVGTVPAIKPACARSVSKRVSVLGTSGTVKREYTQTLIREFGGGCIVTLVGSAELAALAEGALGGQGIDDADLFPRDRALLRAGRRRCPHRHHRARLYALPAVARPPQSHRALAGGMDRSGSRQSHGAWSA